MYKHITIEHSLFFINEQYITEFQQIAEKMQPFLTINNPGVLNLEDMWIEAFNLWLLLHPEEDNIVESFDKTLYYSLNHILFHALKNDYHINFLRSHSNSTSEHLYILSILLLNELNQWFIKLLDDSNHRDIINRNQNCNYFLMHLQSKFELQQFMKDQSLLVKLFVHHSTNTNEFDRLVKKCCDEAHFLSQDLFNSFQQNPFVP